MVVDIGFFVLSSKWSSKAKMSKLLSACQKLLSSLGIAFQLMVLIYFEFIHIFQFFSGTCPFGRSHVDVPKGDLNADHAIDDYNVELIEGSTIYPFGSTESYPYMVDTASAVSIDTAHAYAECSNKGLCDRVSGSCECLVGYEGAACQRASCPSKGVEKRSDAVQREQSKFVNQRGVNAAATSAFDGVSVMNIPIGICSDHGVCRSIEKLADDDGGNFYGLWDKETSMGCDCDAG